MYCYVRLRGPPHQMNSHHREKQSRQRVETRNKQLTKKANTTASELNVQH